MTATAESDSRVARALAAPTRAAILDLLKARGPLAVKEVADEAEVHPNVARGHLEVLSSAGLVRTSWRRHSAGGRPAKVYEAAPGHTEEGGHLVSEILATVLELAAPSPPVARQVAESAGERLGRRFNPGPGATFDEQAEALLRALSTVSGGMRVRDRGPDWVEFEDFDCPFKGIAEQHPETACTLDKALKEGVMRALGTDAFVELVTSVAWGDPTCREVVRVRSSG
ncbi:MAG: helix-turn-helix domain-containing protein [Acidobacteria bacterium]|nr:helix-turn-helix domain-containing protein [Acidobacteriota bacterium]